MVSPVPVMKRMQLYKHVTRPHIFVRIEQKSGFYVEIQVNQFMRLPAFISDEQILECDCFWSLQFDIL